MCLQVTLGEKRAYEYITGNYIGKIINNKDI